MNNIEMLKKINKSEADIIELNEQLDTIEKEIVKKPSINNESNNDYEVLSSAKTKELISLIPKGEKGDPGSASVAIDDSVTNTSQTWSSNKINKDMECQDLILEHSMAIDYVSPSSKVFDVTLNGAFYLYNKKFELVYSNTLNQTFNMPNWSILVVDTYNRVTKVVPYGTKIDNTRVFVLLINNNGKLKGSLEIYFTKNEEFLSFVPFQKNITFRNVDFNLTKSGSDYNVSFSKYFEIWWLTQNNFDYILNYTSKAQFDLIGYPCTFTLKPYQMLILDLDDKLVKVIDYKESTKRSGKYLKLLHYISTDNNFEFDGLFSEYIINQKISYLQNELTNNGVIPSYYITHMETKVSEIRNSFIGMNSFAFSLVADTHIESSSMNTGKLLKYIDDKCSLSVNLNLGDLINFGTTKEIAKEKISTMVDMLNLNNKTLHTIGNHDYNSTVYPMDETQFLTNNEVYNYITRRNQKDVVSYDNDKNVYFYDDNRNKVRYVCVHIGDKYTSLNKLWGISKDQFDWLINNAFNMSGKTNRTEWDIVVFGHIPPQSDLITGSTGGFVNQTQFTEVLQAFKNGVSFTKTLSGTGDYSGSISGDFANKNCNLIGYFAGHVHYDNIAKINDVNYITVNCDTASKYLDMPDRVLGTISENSFDIAIVNKDAKTVSLIKIGAGTNRTFNY